MPSSNQKQGKRDGGNATGTSSSRVVEQSLAQQPAVDLDTAQVDVADAAEVAWMQSMVQQEVAKLKGMGQKVLPLKVKNTLASRSSGKLVHRVEVASNFDFGKVQSLLLSDVHSMPDSKDAKLVFVVCLTGGPLPVLVPYLFHSSGVQDNDLKEWLFVTNNGKTFRHSIKGGLAPV